MCANLTILVKISIDKILETVPAGHFGNKLLESNWNYWGHAVKIFDPLSVTWYPSALTLDQFGSAEPVRIR